MGRRNWYKLRSNRGGVPTLHRSDCLRGPGGWVLRQDFAAGWLEAAELFREDWGETGVGVSCDCLSRPKGEER